MLNVIESFKLYNPENVNIFRLNNGQYLPLIELNDGRYQRDVNAIIEEIKNGDGNCGGDGNGRRP